MKKMIFDVPATSGGALTVLNEFYLKADKDNANKYYFVVSIGDLRETKNIKILSFPWIKKSWFHRYFFDKIIAPYLVRKYEVDEVFSLQNIIIPRVKVKQGVYIHQSIPFVSKKFKFFENHTYWIYQNIIGRMIKKSIKKADYITVQTNWMKDAVKEVLGNEFKTIVVERPQIDRKFVEYFDSTRLSHFHTFFYPASSQEYKNHKVIVQAVKEMVPDIRKKIKVIFTLDPRQDDKIVEGIVGEINDHDLPIYLVGNLSQKAVFKYYKSSILVFPSYIETFGLPLLEAKVVGSPIIASNEAFSKEILSDYKYVSFFNPYDYQELSQIMVNLVNNGFAIYSD